MSWVCREFSNIYNNIHIEKEIGVAEQEIPIHLRTVIYRIIQEAFNNVAKHSRAEFVHLRLQRRNRSIELMISDNGDGFDLDRALSVQRNRRGIGLASMRERAELSGGHFSIESLIGEGTVVTVVWPLEDKGPNRLPECG